MKASKKVITLTVAILAVSSLTISACAPGFKADVLDANNPVAPEQIDSKNINDKKNENPKPSSDKNDDSSNSQNIKMDGTEDTSASSIDQNLLSNTQTITVSEQNSTNETNTPPPNPETSSPAESKDDQTTSAAATAAAAATTAPQKLNQNAESTAIIVNDANKDAKTFQIISVHTEIPKSLNTKADANVDDKANIKTTPELTPEITPKGWWDSVTGLFNSWTDDSKSDVKLEPVFNLVSNFKLGNDLIFITTQHKWFKTEDKKENPNSQFYEKTFENLGIKINFQVFVQHNWKAIKLSDFPEKIYYALKVKKLSDNSTTQAIIAVYKVKSPLKTITLNINSDQLVKNLTKNDKGSETVNLANWTFANMMWHAKNLK